MCIRWVFLYTFAFSEIYKISILLLHCRLSDMENHLQENLDGKLQEWTNQASSVEGWITREEKKFQAMGGIAPNLEAAMKQKPRVEVKISHGIMIIILNIRL